jgi:acylphosphatase
MARTLELTGWVSNLWDGRVEMEVQGEPEVIRELIRRLQMERGIRIEDIEQEELPVKPGERKFRVI